MIEEPEEINADFDGSLSVNDETMDIVDSNKDEEEELQIEVYIHEKWLVLGQFWWSTDHYWDVFFWGVTFSCDIKKMVIPDNHLLSMGSH